METFIWTILVITGIESVLKIVCLALGAVPQKRSNASVAIEVVLGFGFILWGAILLSGASG